jgi:peptidoglycan/LPS O-acetylase OafA/YrhL
MTSPPAQLQKPSHNRASTGYLPTLDGWRAIAILLVILDHGGMFYFSDQGPHPSPRLQSYALRGAIGVDIFFAISGFLICTLLLREQQKTARINLRSFYTRRIFRILPPYLLYLAVITALSAAGLIIVQKRELLASLLFFRNYLPAVDSRDIGWYTGHFWSLAVEEHFYLLWPAMLLFLHRRHATLAAIALIIAIALWRSLDLRFHLFPLNSEILDHRTDLRLDSLLYGCLFALAFSSQANSLQSKLNFPIWLISAAALIILTADFFSRTPLRESIADTIRPPLFAILVVATVIHPHWLIARVLEDARLRWIGRISYSLYIWQQFFLVIYFVPRPLPGGRWQELPLSLISILACATASYYLVEQPLIHLAHRLTRPSPAPAIPPTIGVAA